MSTQRINDSLSRALRELHDERARIDDAIKQLESLMGQAPRRGRPPGSGAAATGGTQRRWSASSRAAAAERMKRYWANRKKGTAVKTKAANAKKTTGRKSWSPAARKAAAERMKRYWAERRKGASNA